MFKDLKKVKDLGGCFLINDQWSIEKDETSDIYLEIMEWSAQEGNEIEPQFTLEELKELKICEIKKARDLENIEPICDTSAAVINPVTGVPTGLSSFFVFHTDRHPTNPAADPTVLLTNAVVMGQTIPYSTTDLGGNKITIALTPSLARELIQHLSLRNNNNYKLADTIVSAVRSAGTCEAVKAISWDTKYLD